MIQIAERLYTALTTSGIDVEQVMGVVHRLGGRVGAEGGSSDNVDAVFELFALTLTIGMLYDICEAIEKRKRAGLKGSLIGGGIGIGAIWLTSALSNK